MRDWGDALPAERLALSDHLDIAHVVRRLRGQRTPNDRTQAGQLWRGSRSDHYSKPDTGDDPRGRKLLTVVLP